MILKRKQWEIYLLGCKCEREIVVSGKLNSLLSSFFVCSSSSLPSSSSASALLSSGTAGSSPPSSLSTSCLLLFSVSLSSLSSPWSSLLLSSPAAGGRMAFTRVYNMTRLTVNSKQPFCGSYPSVPLHPRLTVQRSWTWPPPCPPPQSSPFSPLCVETSSAHRPAGHRAGNLIVQRWQRAEEECTHNDALP